MDKQTNPQPSAPMPPAAPKAPTPPAPPVQTGNVSAPPPPNPATPPTPPSPPQAGTPPQPVAPTTQSSQPMPPSGARPSSPPIPAPPTQSSGGQSSQINTTSTPTSSSGVASPVANTPTISQPAPATPPSSVPKPSNPSLSSPGQPPAPPLPPKPTVPGASTPPPASPVKVENPTTQLPPSDNSSGGGLIKKVLAIFIGLAIVIGGGFGIYFWLTNQTQDQTPTVNQPSQTGGGPVLPEGTTANLVYWGLWESETSMRPVLDQFEAEYPGITVEYVQQNPQDYRERLQSAVVSGDGPDIFRYHNTWVPMLRNQLTALPSDVMSTSEFQQTFYPVITEDLSSDNGIVGMPLMIDGLALYYNVEMFNTAGKQVPNTWEDLRRTAIDLTIRADERVERAGVALGLAENVDGFSDILGLMILQNGASPANPSSSLAQDAIDFYTIFNQSDRIWNATLPPSTFAFANERAAMMIGPSWRAHEIGALNPDLNFEIAPLPQLPERQVSWASYWVEGVSSTSTNQLAAWVLLDYLAEKENLRTMYTAASQERLFGNPFPRVDMADQLIGDPYVGAYIQQAPYAQSWPMAARTFDNGLNDRVIEYYKNFINAGVDEESLETLSSGITQILSQYGVNPN